MELGVGQVLGHRIFRVSCQWASTSRKLWSKWPQVDQVNRKSAKSSRVVKSSTSRWSRSTKQPSRSFHQTRMTTGSICHRHSNTTSCIAEQDQRSAVAIFLTSMSVRVCRPKLFKNLCLSIVSGVSPLLFQDYTPVPHSAPCYATELGLALELVTV